MGPPAESASADSDPSDGRRRHLAVAIASGVVLAGLFLGSLFWHPAAFSGVVALLVVIGLVETSRTFRDAGEPVALPVVVVASVVMLGGAYAAAMMGQIVGLLVLFLGAAAWELTDGDRDDVVRAIGNSCFLGIWVGFLGSYAVLLATLESGAVVATLAVVGGAIVTDVGAYFTGTTIGRHRIAPTVSPHKTWEGLIGGLALAALLGGLVLPLVGDRFDVWSAVVVALVTGLAGFFGDLFESMFKRDLGVKDMGAIIPGHGGVLDRVDGILVALPVGYYFLLLSG